MMVQGIQRADQETALRHPKTPRERPAIKIRCLILRKLIISSQFPYNIKDCTLAFENLLAQTLPLRKVVFRFGPDLHPFLSFS